VVSGPRARPGQLDLRRVVAGVDGSPGGDHAVDVAAGLARRTGADLLLVEVFPPGPHTFDVPESAHVRRVAGRLHAPGFDTLHDRHPAHGILRFVGTGEQTIIAVGMSAARRWRAHGRVSAAVVRHAPCPVLIVPDGGPAQGG
jgi:nucleotide-binding universal stress UspA family protein